MHRAEWAPVEGSRSARYRGGAGTTGQATSPPPCKLAMDRESVFSASLAHFLAPIQPFLDDSSVTEVMVNGYREVYVERAGQLQLTDAAFESEHALESAVRNIAQFVSREVDAAHPILDARLPDGSRVHAVLPPCARQGTYLTIRKFRRDAYSLPDFIRLGSIPAAATEFLSLAVQLRRNILISGGTGTGKTSFLNALSGAIPETERIVVIEDSSELQLAQAHCLTLESRPAQSDGTEAVDIRDLFKASLRMRPDRIIVGEVRGGEALDLVQSMISGHAGSLSTVHATSPREALMRLETLSLMSEVDLPIYVARTQIASAISLIVQLERSSETGRRRIARIAEQRGLDRESQYQTVDLFTTVWERSGHGPPLPQLRPTGQVASFASELRDHGWEPQAGLSKTVWGLS